MYCPDFHIDDYQSYYDIGAYFNDCDNSDLPVSTKHFEKLCLDRCFYCSFIIDL